MPYVNSRGQLVDQRNWSWKSPMNGILAFVNVVILFFTTLIGTLGVGTRNSSSSTDRRSGGGSRGSGGGGGGGGGFRGGRGGFGGFPPASSMPPPGCGPCSGGGCGM